MPLCGYVRVSTIDQDYRLQRPAVRAAGCEVIHAEKTTGSRRDGSSGLRVLLDLVQPGGTLVDPATVRQLRDQEKLGPAAMARRLGTGRASVYRVHGKAT